MRIGFVTTYPPIDCGIATYSSYLIIELEKLGNLVYIISETGAKGERVYLSYKKQDPDLSQKIFQAILEISPDIVHIQHEFGLFGPHHGVSVIPLIYKFRLSKTN